MCTVFLIINWKQSTFRSTGFCWSESTMINMQLMTTVRFMLSSMGVWYSETDYNYLLLDKLMDDSRKDGDQSFFVVCNDRQVRLESNISHQINLQMVPTQFIVLIQVPCTSTSFHKKFLRLLFLVLTSPFQTIYKFDQIVNSLDTHFKREYPQHLFWDWKNMKLSFLTYSNYLDACNNIYSYHNMFFSERRKLTLMITRLTMQEHCDICQPSTQPQAVF